ncbi:MAG: O-antigen ligase family protein [Acidimicrobiales bacterium]
MRTTLSRPRLARPTWLWLAPPAVFAVVLVAHDNLAVVVAVVVGGGFVLVVQRRVEVAASALLVAVLFNSVGLPVLFRLGVPAPAVQAASLWKEGLVAGCLVGVVARRSWRRPDAIDVAALAYVAIGTLYLLVPEAFLGHGPGSSLSLYDRGLGWRSDVFYVVAFLVFRHLHLDRAVVDRIMRRVLGATVVTGLVGIFEFVWPSAWNRLAVHVIGVTTYRHLVLHQQPSSQFNLDSILTYEYLGGHQFLRIGSLLFDDIVVGFVFAVGLGIAAEIVARGKAPAWVWASLPVLAVALLLTQTRSAIVAGALATAFALRHRAGKSLAGRDRLAKVLAAVVVVTLPIAVAAGLLSRFTSDTGANTTHASSYRAAVEIMVHQPLGRGLSTAAGGGLLVAQQQDTIDTTSPAVVTESQYLQEGTQLGVAGLAAYLAVVVMTTLALSRRRGGDRLALAPAAMSNVAVGVAVGALTTQPFVSVEVALLFWCLAGLALGVVDQTAGARPGPGGRGVPVAGAGPGSTMPAVPAF